MIKIDTLLNVIGIILIVVSIILINRSNRSEKRMYEEITSMYDDVKNYYSSLENVINTFDDLVENSLTKIERFQGSNDYKVEEVISEKSSETITKNILIDNDIINNDVDDDKQMVYEKILNLRKIGLSSREIAQKLKIGVREVEIILKMMEKK